MRMGMIYPFLICFLCDVFILFINKHIVCLGFFNFLLCFLCEVFILLSWYKQKVCLGVTKSWKKNKLAHKIIDIQWNKCRNRVGRLHFVDDVIFAIHSTVLTFQWYDVMTSSTENVSCKVASFFYQHSVVIYHILYQTPCIRLSLNLKEKT